MNVIEFINKLNDIPFPKEIYRNADYSEQFIIDLIEAYSVKKKNKLYIRNNNPIIELMDNYDLSKLSICYTSFYEKYEEDAEFIFFANFDADILAIEKETEEVCLIDSQSINNYRMLSCAASSSNFLATLVEAANFNEKRAIYQDLQESKIAEDKANLISEIAGGNKYLQFSKLLIGI
jgi:hypothetical protein